MLGNRTFHIHKVEGSEEATTEVSFIIALSVSRTLEIQRKLRSRLLRSCHICCSLEDYEEVATGLASFLPHPETLESQGKEAATESCLVIVS